MKRDTPALLFPLLLCCSFIIGLSGKVSGDALKNVAPAEKPLVITSGYGVDGLVLWLAADSGVTKDASSYVTSLVDKTQNFTLTPNEADQAPTFVSDGLHGKPVLRFDSDQSLYSSDTFDAALDRDMTIIVVAMTTSAHKHQQFPIYLGQNTAPHVNRSLCYHEGYELFDGQMVAFYGPKTVANTFLVMGASVNSDLKQATFYRNGQQTLTSGLAKENGNATFGNLSPGVTLGAATGPFCGWQGDIAEVLVYDRQLSATEMQAISVALAQKYGLPQL